MATLDLTHLETLLAAATPGPWEICEQDPAYRWTVVGPNGEMMAASSANYSETFSREDTEALVALRNAAPALIARVRELEEALEEYANPKNWMLRGRFNPCDGGFDGTSFAEKHLR